MIEGVYHDLLRISSEAFPDTLMISDHLINGCYSGKAGAAVAVPAMDETKQPLCGLAPT